MARIAPALFILLWSTGFIASKLGVADAEPFTFLAIRFVAVLAILIPVSALLSTAHLTGKERRDAALAGIMMHALYLGGVFVSLRHGMPAGLIAMIVSVQPILTAVAAGPLLGEMVTGRHWLGLALGLAGSFLVLLPRLSGTGLGVDAVTLSAALVALGGMTAGTLYQKRHATGIDLVGGTIWQYVGALAVIGPAALLFEQGDVRWTMEFAFALLWLVVVLSIGAIVLLMYIIRHNGVAKVTSLFYLVPATTALMAFAMFGESLNLLQLLGMVLVMIGVLLIRPAGTRSKVDD